MSLNVSKKSMLNSLCSVQCWMRVEIFNKAHAPKPGTCSVKTAVSTN